jgi:TPR repeat protein
MEWGRAAGVRQGWFSVCLTGAAALGLVLAPAVAQDGYGGNRCGRIFAAAGMPSAMRATPVAPPPGFDAREAVRACRESVERFPEDPLLRYLLADAHWLAGEHEAAVRVLARRSARFGGSGTDVLARHPEAFSLLQRLAETDADAQVALAHLYLAGGTVPADPDRAAALFRRAADQGNAEGSIRSAGHCG